MTAVRPDPRGRLRRRHRRRVRRRRRDLRQPDGPAADARRPAVPAHQNPDLVISDGESSCSPAPRRSAAPVAVEGWIPFRRVFDVVAYGKRHVMMGATQVDRHGNQNISASATSRSRSGSCSAPAARRATRSTTGRPTGCRSTPRGSSSSRSTSSPASATTARRPRRAASTTSTGRLQPRGLRRRDADHALRLASVHPGVTLDEVQRRRPASTRRRATCATTREPTDEELSSCARCSTRRACGSRRCPDAGRRSPSSSASGTRSCRPAWAGSPARGWWRHGERRRPRHPGQRHDDLRRARVPPSSR